MRTPAHEGVEVHRINSALGILTEPRRIPSVVPAVPGVGDTGRRIGPEALEEIVDSAWEGGLGVALHGPTTEGRGGGPDGVESDVDL